MSGTVYLVGAGPGAPDLLTLRAARLLERADIVFHDALVPQAILSLALRAIKIAVGKRSGQHSTAQKFINKRLVDAARMYPVVVRLKGGDPMLFGRAQEELAWLQQHRIRCEVVPGVTAALAASADLGVSLTARGWSRSVAFLTMRTAAGARPNNWLKVALAADTVVIYMGAGEAEEISRALIGAGKSPATPLAIVEHASLPGMRKLAGTLEQLPALAERCGNGPVAILLGEVYREIAASGIIAPWLNQLSAGEQLSFSPTVRATRGGRAHSSNS
ncbi:MAG: uroporphyrinogen-III C-methyltransferase [Betaproteobacteria bacterium]|nr:uroporphyrinogen-III C-methyltransferase [Betaproteobacteria bacterium]MSQ87845.1 uroporphyrinogen-III C-methyltransferase [Betaproteobacteria bacterium]